MNVICKHRASWLAVSSHVTFAGILPYMLESGWRAGSTLSIVAFHSYLKNLEWPVLCHGSTEDVDHKINKRRRHFVSRVRQRCRKVPCEKTASRKAQYSIHDVIVKAGRKRFRQCKICHLIMLSFALGCIVPRIAMAGVRPEWSEVNITLT